MRAQLIPATDDPELDARRTERVAWHHYVALSRSLAEMPLSPPKRRHEALKRVEKAKADFAVAWKRLEGATQ